MKKSKVTPILKNVETELNKLGTYVEDYETLIGRIENEPDSNNNKGLWSGNLAANWVLNAKKDCKIIAELDNVIRKTNGIALGIATTSTARDNKG